RSLVREAHVTRGVSPSRDAAPLLAPVTLQAIADEMKAAQDVGGQLAPFSARLGGFDNATAYQVARLIHEARIREGASPVGRKIAFRTRAMGGARGVREPIWAHVYDTTVVRLSGPRLTFRLGKLVEPRIEPEIVLHFRSAAPTGDDPRAILACVDWIAHG